VKSWLTSAICRFARDSLLTQAQSDVMMSMVSEIIAIDSRVWQRSASESFKDFQERVLHHSVERPPWSHGTFEPSTAVAITDQMLLVYYRHFQLFKYCLASIPDGKLTQTAPGGVDAPSYSKPLQDAILVMKY
jgi:hypothetical protein